MNQTFESSTDKVAATKQRILDAAEQLFSEHGFAATGLRMITAEAGVNLAAVNYHFQGKEGLIRAVLRRKMGPMNDIRIRILDEVEARYPEGPLPLEEVLTAFLKPIVDAKCGGADTSNFGKLMGRLYTEPGGPFEPIFRESMSDMKRRFSAAFRRALPGTDPVEVAWGMYFCIGAISHYLAAGGLLQFLSSDEADPMDAPAVTKRFVEFIGAGLRALEAKR